MESANFRIFLPPPSLLLSHSLNWSVPSSAPSHCGHHIYMPPNGIALTSFSFSLLTISFLYVALSRNSPHGSNASFATFTTESLATSRLNHVNLLPYEIGVRHWVFCCPLLSSFSHRCNYVLYPPPALVLAAGSVSVVITCPTPTRKSRAACFFVRVH